MVADSPKDFQKARENRESELKLVVTAISEMAYQRPAAMANVAASTDDRKRSR
jgi:hypothetical protein